MIDVALFLKEHNLRVEQVQEFTPAPGSLATCIYHTGRDPQTGEAVHVPRDCEEKRLQKALLLYHLPEQRQAVLEALRRTGREAERDLLLGSSTDRLRASDRQKQMRRDKTSKRRRARQPSRKDADTSRP
jgi:hypothetical protein